MADRRRKSTAGKVAHRGSMRSESEKRTPRAWIPLSIAAFVVLCCIVGLVYYLQNSDTLNDDGTVGIFHKEQETPAPTRNLGPKDLTYPGIVAREEGSAEPAITANPNIARDLSYLAEDATFTEAQINAPGIYGNELFFSAGTGNLDTNVLTKLYLYNLETKTEEKIATTEIYMGEYYETLINDKWFVYLETDHGKKNNIYVRDRASGATTLLKTCTNGKPKLRLYENTLIWMEQEEQAVDHLYMVDLVSQENLTLFTFEDVATYGVSAPAVYGDWIVWAAPDPNQSEEERKVEEHSAIYYLNISCDFDETGNIKPRIYCPGTYVHEPYFNGEYFLWIDTNKSFRSNLYIAAPGDAAPTIIDTRVTAYGLGDDIVVYGRDSVVWLYIVPTGELCRLTSLSERGILPQVNGRTVVWQNTAADGSKDTLRYKMLTDADLFPNGKPTVEATPNPNLYVPDPTPTPTPDPNATPEPEPTVTPTPDPNATATPVPTVDPKATVTPLIPSNTPAPSPSATPGGN